MWPRRPARWIAFDTLYTENSSTAIDNHIQLPSRVDLVSSSNRLSLSSARLCHGRPTYLDIGTYVAGLASCPCRVNETTNIGHLKTAKRSHSRRTRHGAQRAAVDLT